MSNGGAIQIPPFTADDTPRIGVSLLETRVFLITDIEVFTNDAWFLARMIGRHDLADAVLQAGLDWEHAVALAPMDPLSPNKSSDPVMQAEIDRLDVATEALVVQVNAAAVEYQGGGGTVAY